jgi:LysM repeat protein
MDEVSRGFKKMRILTGALIFSGALNIGLIATGIFTSSQEESSHFSVRSVAKNKARIETSFERYFGEMNKRSFHELVSFLTNKETVEEGFLKRDIALAALVAFHHFHLEKSLAGFPLQRRTLSLGDGSKIEVFPALSNEHFEAILRFAYEEKWPLTTEGLFKLLKKWEGARDESLVQAFLVTPEFHAVQVLFQKTESPQPSHALLNVLLEGPWDFLDQFAKQQAQLLDLSVDKRRSLLLSYLALGSRSSAQLLLTTDFAFIAKRLEDQGIIGMLSLLDEKSPEAERLCLELLASPRSDAVWSSASSALYRYAGEEIPSPLNLREARSKFLSLQIPATPPKIEIGESVKLREHVVKDGESLWKIARQYNVKVDEIVKVNQMEKDRLFPGMVLRIP